LETVLRLLRGESLDGLSRKLGVTAARLSAWRDTFLAHGRSARLTRQPDAKDEEIRRLRAKIGEITMENELFREEARRLKAGLPLPPGRSRR
jgi:transposase-like protein